MKKVMPNASFWKGRRVLLTGHTGFKGSWLTLWLEALGADVTGYALDPPTQPNLFEQAGVASSVRTICADIRDFQQFKAAIGSTRPEVIIHMAAQTVVRSRLRGSHRNLFLQRNGDRSPLRSSPAVGTALHDR